MTQENIIEPFGHNTELPAGYPLTSSLDENNAQIGASAAAAYILKRMITGSYANIDVADIEKENLYIDQTNVRWLVNYQEGGSYYQSVSLEVNGGERVKVAWDGTGELVLAVVTDAEPTNLGSIDFASGESLRKVSVSDGEVEFVVPSDAYRIVFNWRTVYNTTPFSLAVETQESYVRGMIERAMKDVATTKNNQIVVAASNTPDELKAIADYVCDGTNDEVEVQSAIDSAIANGYKVLMLRGDYYLDAPTKNYTSTQDAFILIKTSPTTSGGNSRSVVIEGEGAALGLTANLRISSAAYESLDGTKQYSLLAVYDSTTYGGFVELNNLRTYIPSNQKKICSMDFLNYGGYARLHSIHCFGYTNGYNGQNITISNPPAVAVEGCIGIRFIGKGPNGSYGSEITDCNFSGFNEGICINTEWTVLNHVCSIFCVTGWVFGKYTSSGIHAQCHPTVLICCGDERGVNLPVFYNSTNGLQNIDMIAFSIERNAANTPGGVLGNYATERVQGSSRGRIDYTQGQASNSTTARFWEYGHGHNMTTRNMAHAASGTTTVRNGYAPNYMQRYFDTSLGTNGKEIICIDESGNNGKGTWVDANGNNV